MPIEFACEECGSVLRVPDGSSGKRSRCPACKHEQEIPFVVDSADSVVPSGKLSIPCPKCQHHLVCEPELLGTRGQCKKCAHIFTISKEPAPAEDAAPALVFHCPECHQLFEGREDMRGRKGKCHVCQAVFAIELELAPVALPATTNMETAPTPVAQPTPQAAQPTNRLPKPSPQPASPQVSLPAAATSQAAVPKPALAANVNDELTLADDGTGQGRVEKTRTAASKPVAVSSQPIRFECSHCQGVMEVPGSTAGMETECPYCQVVLTIPQRSTVSLKAAAPAPAPQTTSYGSPLGNDEFSHPLAGNQFDLGGVNNPYAAPAGAWAAAAETTTTRVRSSALTVGNVLQQGFEALFPSCLIVIVLMLISLGLSLMYGAAVGVVMAIIRPTPENARSVGLIIGLASAPFGIAIGAWVMGSISRTALNAVRRKAFHFGDSLNPGGAFGASILQSVMTMLLSALMYIPALINYLTEGSLRGPNFAIFAGLWLLLVFMLTAAFTLGTCMTLFAGADGYEPTEALQMSISLVLSYPVMTLAICFLSGLIALVLVIPTLGLAYVIPVYMLASLYNLASK